MISIGLGHLKPFRQRWILALVLLLSTLIWACGPDLETTEGQIEALKSGESLGLVVEKISHMSAEQAKPLGEAIQEAYLKGTDAFDDKLANKLIDMKDPAFKKAYLKALRSRKDDLVSRAAIVIGSLGLKDVGDAFADAYDATSQSRTQETLIEQGIKLGLPEMADRAKTVLAGDLNGVSIRLIKLSCQILEKFPDPKVADDIAAAAFYRQHNTPIHAGQECALALQALDGKTAYEVSERLRKRKIKKVNKYINTKGLMMAYENVLLGAIDLLLASGHLDGVKSLLDFLNPDISGPVEYPVDIDDLRIKYNRALPGAPQKQQLGQLLNDMIRQWMAYAVPAYQNAMMAVTKLTVKGHEDEARKVFLQIFSWDKKIQRKFSRFTGNPAIEPVYRAVAARILSEQGLLEDEKGFREDAFKVILDALNSPEFEEWKDNDPSRYPGPLRRVILLGNMIVVMSVASMPGWKDKIYAPLKEIFDNTVKDKKGTPTRVSRYGETETAEKQFKSALAAFELADECKTDVKCYESILDHAQAVQEVFNQIDQCDKDREKEEAQKAQEWKREERKRVRDLEMEARREAENNGEDPDEAVKQIDEEAKKRLPPTLDIYQCYTSSRLKDIKRAYGNRFSSINRVKELLANADICKKALPMSKEIKAIQKEIDKELKKLREKYKDLKALKKAWKADPKNKKKKQAYLKRKKQRYDAYQKVYKKRKQRIAKVMKKYAKDLGDLAKLYDAKNGICMRETYVTYNEDNEMVEETVDPLLCCYGYSLNQIRMLNTHVFNKGFFELGRRGDPQKHFAKLVGLYQGNYDPDAYRLNALFQLASRAPKGFTQSDGFKKLEEVIKNPKGKDAMHSKAIKSTLHLLKRFIENRDQ